MTAQEIAHSLHDTLEGQGDVTDVIVSRGGMAFFQLTDPDGHIVEVSVRSVTASAPMTIGSEDVLGKESL